MCRLQRKAERLLMRWVTRFKRMHTCELMQLSHKIPCPRIRQHMRAFVRADAFAIVQACTEIKAQCTLGGGTTKSAGNQILFTQSATVPLPLI